MGRYRDLLIRGRGAQERSPVARAMMSRSYEVQSLADRAGCFAWGLQGEFRASMNSSEKKMILFFALTSS